jgi:serine/threonine-protein kinase
MTELLGGRYRVLQTIGSGGCGQALLVEDTRLPSHRRHVIKQLKPVVTDPEARRIIAERFAREAVILEELGLLSDQIPDLYDFFTEDDEFYLVQEWIEGETLQERVRRAGALSEPDVRHIIANLLRLLEKVHANGIIHRDIKPNNVVLRTRDGLPVLIDFGAVKDLYATVSSPDGVVTRSVVIGSPGYMALEQAAGRPVFASDLYGLGLTALYLLSGRQPADLMDKSTGEVRWPVPAVSLTKELETILKRAARAAPNERYQTAGEMLEALEADERTRVAARQVESLDQFPEYAPPPLSPSRRVWPAWALSGALALGYGAVGYFYYQKHAQAAQTQAALETAGKELAAARASREEAEKRSRNAEEKARKTEQAAKQIWRVANIANGTGQFVSYEVLNAEGGWDSFTLEPDETRAHWRLNTELIVRFSQSSSFLRREKTQPVRGASVIMGREPNEDEKNSAKTVTFRKDEPAGDIILAEN